VTHRMLHVDVRAVLAAAAEVPDPEMPSVTIGMLGMVHDARVRDDGTIVIEVLPTFSGCPATKMIERDIRTACQAVPGVTSVEVIFPWRPRWTPDRINESGRARLREVGIAPPLGSTAGLPERGERPALPLVAMDAPARACPWCGSSNTVRESMFGPTPCRDIRFCEACQQPFEAFKQL
jgi:ring-1,2-phenylacetyl-CoA epoxidase subunit PaaD